MDGGKLLYKCREVEMRLLNGKYFVGIEDEGNRAVFFNPILAWSFFVDVLDGRVRRRIGDMLEQEGKNRYTGEPLKQSEGVKKDAE